MQKPAFVFDGRNIVYPEKLREIGFIVYSIGKLLDHWLRDMPAIAEMRCLYTGRGIGSS
jgi:UDPglucose 6-dehydrogenase